MSASEFGICTYDREGFLLTSNEAHGIAIGRSRDGRLGHHWKEWSPPGDLARLERAHELCLAGTPQIFTKRLIRPNNTVLLARVHTFPTSEGVMATMSTVPVSPDNDLIEQIGHAEYVAELMVQMQIMASESGALHRLLPHLRQAETDALGFIEAIEIDRRQASR